MKKMKTKTKKCKNILYFITRKLIKPEGQRLPYKIKNENMCFYFFK